MIVAEEAEEEEEVEGLEPVVKTTLLEVAVFCEVVFVNTALDVLVNWNWAEAEPNKARPDRTIAVLIATWG